ncbi:MAG: RNA polymerase-associated protein RapA [Gammaproteobacteria bacterium]|nr:RNA polymerase-associated protein RapA [Gammaproteobacteria bacterium]
MDNKIFIPGQRWISDPESELGLGTVLSVKDRQVTIVFMYSGETRIYSTETAPLTRVQFHVGDSVESHENWRFTITDVEEADGLLVYHGIRENGETVILPETGLSNFIQLNRPQERLQSGQLDDNKWFELRARTYDALQALSHSPVYGLRGGRVELIEHQFYIASEVGSRVAPRVLLADEVGLGKTIEAGLILHYQLLREEIHRVLLIVPDPLVHQWLVEMLRRFNLHFQIMDDKKYQAIAEESADINPFASSQLVLCSLDFLTGSEQVRQDVVAAGWDTLVVDEAHHLGWSETSVSPEYALVEQLATVCPSVLLLTATPQQLGMAGHFARLRLLDSDRFSRLDDFIAEAGHYDEIADLASSLHSSSALAPEAITSLRNTVGDDFLSADEWRSLAAEADGEAAGIRQNLLSRLIDQHGTGRLLFRNSRAAISGFPARHLHHHRLAADADEREALLDWLNTFLRKQYPAKSLMICANPDTVMELSEGLRVRFGLHAAVFHEQMSIVERDRAAAWFASPEDDCSLLISSEIGSEGRNFQFLHDLILAEIPNNPDLLEQRIGRLDRIGQQADVQIHVPCQDGSRDHRLLRWYHEGLNAFEQTCAAGAEVAAEVGNSLQAILKADQPDEAAMQALIDNSRRLTREKNHALETGRDRLLELNSNRPEVVAPLLDSLRRQDRDHALADYMAAVFDCFSVDFEEQSDDRWIVRPGRHMRIANFPGIPDEGLTLTFDRQVALAREDVEFLTWDHPIVGGAMDLVVSNPEGQAGLAIIEAPELPHGAMFLESLFRVQCTSNNQLNTERYLPPETLRFVLAESGKDLAAQLGGDYLRTLIHPAEKSQTRAFIKSRAADIQSLIKQAEQLAAARLPALQNESRQGIESELDESIRRLQHLRSFNPLIREDEITTLRQRRQALLDALDGVVVQLVALRVLVNIH